ncbi:MAG: 4-(cytidine 5'-diphospho)-2-C-methyl-D-erythritol kinase [Gammaproteobacteria bacterium]
MKRSLAWPAPAKINLFLHVTGRRPDGYHLLQTLFQFVDLCDWLDFTVRDDGRISRSSVLPGVAAETDLVVRAASRLKHHAGCALGADIAVRKQVPMGGGLGGGSSNAATVLVALNALWDLGLPIEELASLGLALGADVPVFVHGYAAWAEGVGEVLVPCPQPETAIVLVTPDCAVSTARVFSEPDLTRDTPPSKMHAFSQARSRNDCEPVTRRLYPAVGAALDWLSQHAPARMSGTGASVYAFFDDLERAQAVAAQVPGLWRAYAGRRLNESPLRARLACYAGAG